jgi:hypothetical protein
MADRTRSQRARHPLRLQRRGKPVQDRRCLLYALEATFPDALCRQLEDAARTYMLSEVPQDFICVHLTQTRSGRSQ